LLHSYLSHEGQTVLQRKPQFHTDHTTDGRKDGMKEGRDTG